MDTMKKVLVVVDMQVDFVTGSLGTPEARAIVPAITKKIQDAHAAGIPILFTQDTHYDDYLNTQEGKILPVPHCIEGTVGHEVVPELVEGLSQFYFIEKECFGCEPAVLEDVLMDFGGQGADEYELCGVCTDICIISNAVLLRTLYPESKITVDSKTVAGVTPEKNAAALEVLKSLQVNVI